MTERESVLELFGHVQKVLDQCNRLYAEFAETDAVLKKMKESKEHSVPCMIVGALVAVLGANILFSGEQGGFLFGVALLAGAAFALYTGYNAFKVTDADIAPLENRLKEIVDELDSAYTNSSIAGKYPQMYLYDEAVSFCVNAVQNMRADSVKEAINLYEDSVYKTRMEDLQKNNNKVMENIQRETSQARKAAQFAAAFGGITAYNTSKIRKKLK